MTHHCVIGDYTLVLTFQLDHQTDYHDDVIVVSTVHCLGDPDFWYGMKATLHMAPLSTRASNPAMYL